MSETADSLSRVCNNAIHAYHRSIMTDNAATIRAFYEAFARRDHDAMAACYHPDVQFSDPVFPDLHGDEARAMWHMLCEQGKDLVVTFSDIESDGDSGSARWEATYTFPATGRAIHNKIDASFEFVDGRIIRHTDRFDAWRWLRMAIGWAGVAIGWTSGAKSKLQASAGKGLDRFIEEHPEYRSPDGDA